VRTADTGPLPIGITSSDDSVFVLEGTPDGPPAETARTDVLERLDPASLRVVAHVHVADPYTLTVAGGLVWTLSVTGEVVARDPRSLKEVWRRSIGGTGAGSITVSPNAIWTAIGGASGEPHPGYVVSRIGLAEGRAVDQVVVPGNGTWPLLASGARTWVAVADDEVLDWLYQVLPDESLGEPTYVPRPKVLGAGLGRVWWASMDGQFGSIDELSGLSSPELTLPDDGTLALAISDGAIWVATTSLLVWVPAK
jgi:hypothetical protein